MVLLSAASAAATTQLNAYAHSDNSGSGSSSSSDSSKSSSGSGSDQGKSSDSSGSGSSDNNVGSGDQQGQQQQVQEADTTGTTPPANEPPTCSQPPCNPDSVASPQPSETLATPPVDCKSNPSDPTCNIIPESGNTSSGQGGKPSGSGVAAGNMTGGNQTALSKINQTIPITGNTSSLALSIHVLSDPIVHGNKQNIKFSVSDSKNSDTKIGGVSVKGHIKYVTANTEPISGKTDASGEYLKSWRISGNAKTGTFLVTVDVSKDGYTSSHGTSSFKVIPAQPGPPPPGPIYHGYTSHTVTGSKAVGLQQIPSNVTDFPNNDANAIQVHVIGAKKDIAGAYHVTGEITNVVNQSFSSVAVTAHLYDAAGNLVGDALGYSTPANIDPGHTATFDSLVLPDQLNGKPVSFRLSYDWS
jgi:hypothetical protein